VIPILMFCSSSYGRHLFGFVLLPQFLSMIHLGLWNSQCMVSLCNAIAQLHVTISINASMSVPNPTRASKRTRRVPDTSQEALITTRKGRRPRYM
jgi:hypothetical protein